jgi:2-aminobenzoate-CoA ligase
MAYGHSAHVDSFSRDHLPARETWPELLDTSPSYPDVLNCASVLLTEAVERFGAEQVCMVDDAGTWTYGELADTVDRLARVLTEVYELVPGNRVLLYGSNSPWLVACWFATVMAGGVAVTVAPDLRSKELATIAGLSSAGLALCDAGGRSEVLAAGVAGMTLACFGDDDPENLCGLARRAEPGFAGVPTAADDVALIAFTSGTTGSPKGCMHFHRDVLAVCDTFSTQVLAPRSTDVFAGTPPLGFTYGLGGLVLFPFRAGARTVFPSYPGPAGLLEAIPKHRISVLFTAPSAYRALLDHIADVDLSSLRRCVSAGEHLPVRTWQSWYEATGLRIIDGLGATELLHIFISAADDDIRPGATGRVVPGWLAKVVDENGQEVPDGTPGRLAVRGPIGCRYLYGDRQSEYVKYGWNITGDTYVRDAGGYFWYQGRSDDMIISAGHNISAVEVESVLLTHPAVAEAAVVGKPDDELGQVVAAYIVLRTGHLPGAELATGLQDHVKRSIAAYKHPRHIDFIKKLPRTATNKLQRYRLREGE